MAQPDLAAPAHRPAARLGELRLRRRHALVRRRGGERAAQRLLSNESSWAVGSWAMRAARAGSAGPGCHPGGQSRTEPVRSLPFGSVAMQVTERLLSQV